MAGTINKVILVGNLGRDPEVRQTSSGQRLCNFPVATSDVWNDRQTGERRERTEWHRVVLFDDRLVDLAERYLRKGSKVYLEGKLQTRKWQGQDGQDRYTTEVVLQRYQGVLTMLDSRPSGSGEAGGGPTSGASERRERVGAMDTTEPAPGPGGDTLDDDIPF